jgi:hypothetical protein
MHRTGGVDRHPKTDYLKGHVSVRVCLVPPSVPGIQISSGLLAAACTLPRLCQRGMVPLRPSAPAVHLAIPGAARCRR